MINASMALSKSDNMFEKKYKTEISFIEDRIWEVVNEGFRTVVIKATSNWVSDNEHKTERLLSYFREQGFRVKIYKTGVGSKSKWTNNCDGIEISWGEL